MFPDRLPIRSERPLPFSGNSQTKRGLLASQHPAWSQTLALSHSTVGRGSLLLPRAPPPQTTASPAPMPGIGFTCASRHPCSIMHSNAPRQEPPQGRDPRAVSCSHHKGRTPSRYFGESLQPPETILDHENKLAGAEVPPPMASRTHLRQDAGPTPALGLGVRGHCVPTQGPSARCQSHRPSS